MELPERNLHASVTSRRKLRVVEYCVELNKFLPTNEIITPPKNINTSTWFKGQIINFRIFPEYFFIDETEPRNYCCETMKDNFKLSSYLGWNSEKKVIKHKDNQYSIGSKFQYNITHCPFCGQNLNKKTK